MQSGTCSACWNPAKNEKKLITHICSKMSLNAWFIFWFSYGESSIFEFCVFAKLADYFHQLELESKQHADSGLQKCLMHYTFTHCHRALGSVYELLWHGSLTSLFSTFTSSLASFVVASVFVRDNTYLYYIKEEDMKSEAQVELVCCILISGTSGGTWQTSHILCME